MCEMVIITSVKKCFKMKSFHVRKTFFLSLSVSLLGYRTAKKCFSNFGPFPHCVSVFIHSFFCSWRILLKVCCVILITSNKKNRNINGFIVCVCVFRNEKLGKWRIFLFRKKNSADLVSVWPPSPPPTPPLLFYASMSKKTNRFHPQSTPPWTTILNVEKFQTEIFNLCPLLLSFFLVVCILWIHYYHHDHDHDQGNLIFQSWTYIHSILIFGFSYIFFDLFFFHSIFGCTWFHIENFSSFTIYIWQWWSITIAVIWYDLVI